MSDAGDAKARLPGIWAEMFDVNGCYQKHLVEEAKPFGAGSRIGLLLQAALAVALDQIANPFRLLVMGGAGATNIRNASSVLRIAYRQGIQNTYQRPPTDLGLKTERRESWSETVFKYAERLKLTGIEVPQISFPRLLRFAGEVGLPEFVFNTTVKLRESRGAVPLASRIFEISSTGVGSDSCGFLSWAETEGKGWEPGDRLPSGSSFRQRPDVSPWATLRCANVASAISGAAVSGVAVKGLIGRLLLRVLNLGLEYHVPNPAQPKKILCLSDGGHSENLGLFALLRRGCRTVLVVDGEHTRGLSSGLIATSSGPPSTNWASHSNCRNWIRPPAAASNPGCLFWWDESARAKDLKGDSSTSSWRWIRPSWELKPGPSRLTPKATRIFRRRARWTSTSSPRSS